MGLKELNDWYLVKLSDILNQGGSVLLKKYGDLFGLLSFVYPQHKWNFGRLNQNTHIQRRYIDWLEDQLGLKSVDEWYNFDEFILRDKAKDNALDQFGCKLLQELDNFGSLENFLQFIYPNHKWQSWRLGKVPRNYWTLENQRAYFDWLSKELNLKNMEDWYKYSSSEILARTDNGPLRIYRTLNSALLNVYPEHEWLSWKFDQVPKGYWNKKENQKKLLDWLGEILKIKNLDAWYRISLHDIRRTGLPSLFYKHSKASLLMNAYPDHNWDIHKLSLKPVKSSQRMLVVILQELFPNSGLLC
jgi:hypothetical protein